MMHEPAQSPWLFLTIISVGIIVAVLLSARIMLILGFTSAKVRVKLANVLQAYRKQSLPDVLEALGCISKRCPESGLASFVERRNPSLTGFPKTLRVASIYFEARLCRAQQANDLMKNAAVMLGLGFVWQFTRIVQATLGGISIQRETPIWALAERANEALTLSSFMIGLIALLYILYSFFKFRIRTRKAEWERFCEAVDYTDYGSAS